MASMDYGNSRNSDDVLAILPNDHTFVLKRPYTAEETSGVMVLAIISCISATAVAGLLLAIAISAFNTRKSQSRNLFVRSHVAAYFISMLLCEVAQTVGSIMSFRWVNQKAVSYEPYCTAQGVVKHVADVGNAYWSMIIAVNTFWILFLRWKLKRYVLLSAMLGGWAAIAAIITTGPAALQRTETGPFYAISGYWCWISDEYASERITLDYMIMFLSALLSFVMYILVFLRLRGNILVHGWRVRFRLNRDLSESAPRSVDTHVVKIAKGMLLYPVAYTVLLLPIAICRFAEWTGLEVPFYATVVSDAIFLLSGFVNVVLFLTTRRVLPVHSVFPRSVSGLFRSSRMSDTSSRASGYTKSAYATSTYTTDLEKNIITYEEGRLSRGAPLSALVSAAPTTASPMFTIGSARSEGYDDVPLDSATPGQQAYGKEVDIASAPHDGEYRLSRTDSPTVSVSVPSSAFNPSFPSALPPSRR